MSNVYEISTEEDKEEFELLLSECDDIELKDNKVKFLSGEYSGDIFDIAESQKSVLETCEQIEMDQFIFGKDKTRGVVGIEVENNEVLLFLNDGTIQKRPMIYWVLLPIKLDASCIKLKGKQHYQFIKTFRDEDKYKKFCQKYRKRDIYNIWDARESAMTYYGITFFKDLKLHDVSVLSYDIESDGLVQSKNSIVYMISNTLHKNGEEIKKLFVLEDYSNSGEMIYDWCAWVCSVDPSIIVGHNIFGYDFPYLKHVAKLHGYKLELGKDGSEAKFNTRDSNYRVDGAQVWKYKKIHIYGRQIVDTMFTSVKYDIGRNYPSWGLKSIIEYEGLVKDGRQFYDASKIKKNWHNPTERAKIIEYGKDDADDSLALYFLQVSSFFYMTQSIPKPFQTVLCSASGSWLNSIMVRGYFQKGYAIPKTSEAKRVAGGMSYGIPGVYSNVSKWDAASYYPNTVRRFKMYDKIKDPKAYYYKMVDYFTKRRFAEKGKYKETGDKYYDDLQASSKVFINSAYGLMGTNGLNFNNFDIASEITRCCRKGLQKCILWATGHEVNHWWDEYEEIQDYEDYDWIDKYSELSVYDMPRHDWVLVNIDTDSLSFAKKDGTPFTDEENEMIYKEINQIMYSEWEADGEFDRFVVVKAKNYVMREKGSDKIKLKGSSFIDAKKEPALKELMKNLATNFINGDMDYIKVYHEYLKEATNIQDINRWAVKKSITEKLMEGNDTAKKKVLEAIGDKDIQVGDKVYLYNVIDGQIQKVAKGEPVFLKSGKPKMIDNNIVRLIEDFDGDYDKWHYVKRVYKTMEIFNTIIDMNKVINYTLKKNRNQLEFDLQS